MAGLGVKTDTLGVGVVAMTSTYEELADTEDSDTDVGSTTLEDATAVETKETEGLDRNVDNTSAEVMDGASIDPVGAVCGTTEDTPATDAVGATWPSTISCLAKVKVSPYKAEMELAIA